MIFQQPVVILVLSQEGVRARPSTPPSWLISGYDMLKAVWELIILAPLYFITAYAKSNCKQEYMIGYVTINHQILQQSNDY